MTGFFMQEKFNFVAEPQTYFMSSFEVRGGKALKGTIIPQGAKNEALQILSAVY